MRQLLSGLIGAVGGLVIGFGASMRWGDNLGAVLSSPSFATLLAGLGGATIGGAISYATARQSSILTLKRDQEARTAEENGQALTVLLTVMQLSNRLHTLNLKLSNDTADAHSELWQKLQATPDDTIQTPTFDAKDFIPFINAKQAGLIHRAFLLSDRTRSLEASFRVYGQLRLALEEFMLPFSNHVSGAIVTSIPPQHATSARYQMDQLNGLIKQMQRHCAIDYADAKALINELNEAYKSRFGTSAKFSLAMEEDPSIQSAS